GDAVYAKRDALIKLVKDLNKEGKTVAAYGASGRATVHLNFCKFTTDDVAFVSDASDERRGRLVPGARIPIVKEEVFRKERPDYTILFAYNFLKEILKKEQDYLAAGGKFIIPVPEPKVVDRATNP
ncbi:methyltransferase, partial [Candidatus Woesearchaeota archaeon]|nr:methyltransferase [Candidatus Woesearchaeota archaeon]